MLRWLGSLVLILMLALLGLAGWVVGTEAGAGWLAREAGLLTGGGVRIAGVHGNLVAGVEVDELEIIAGTTRIEGHGLALRVLPAGLLGGRLSVTTLRAQRIDVLIQPASPVKQPFRMPRLSAPFPVDVDELIVGILGIRRGESAQTVTGIRLAASLQDTRLTVRRLQGALGGFELRADGTASLEPELPVDARVEWRLAQPAVSGAGTVRGTLKALEVAQVVHAPDEVTVSGTLYDLSDIPRLKAAANWDALRVEIPGIGRVDTSAGRAALEGTTAAWNATLVAATRALALPDMRARAAAHGDGGRIVFDELSLAGNFGAISARGSVDLAAVPHLRLDATASNVDTAAFRRGLEGNLSARASVDADLPGEVRVRLADLRGHLMGRPLAGAGEVSYREGLVTFSGVALRAGPNRLSADGSFGSLAERVTGRFDLDAPDLAVLWPGLAGSLDGHASLAGTRARPLVDLVAHGHGLAFAGNAVQGMKLRARIDRLEHVQAELLASGISAGSNVFGNLDASLGGTLSAHTLSAHLSGGAFEARLASAGSWDGTTLRQQIGTASIATAALGEWRLFGEPEAAFKSDTITVADHCWEQATASLCLRGLTWSPMRARVVAELRGFDLQRLDPWLGADFAISGRAYAAMWMESTAAGLNGAAIWRQEDTRVTYNGSDEPLVTPLDTAQLAAQVTPEQVLATLELHAVNGVHLSGNGRMQSPLGETAAIDARIAGQLPDIAPLVPWLAGDLDLADVAGRVTMDAAVTGTMLEPRVTGQVRLSDGAVALADLGVKLEAIDVALQGDGSPALMLRGSAKAGGALTLDGEVRPIEKGGPEGWVRIRGQTVDAVRLPDRYIQATPDITLRYAAGQLSTEGGVTIPKAEIVVRSLPESAAAPSRDAVVRDRPAAAEQETGHGQTIGGELALNLGRDVRLKGFGLDTRLEGTVKLSQGADGEPRGYGVVRLEEGKFGAYGKELTIERGTLGFSGPLDDPAVDIRATRRVDWEGKTVTAGILVSGTASRPESRVFSDPAMSEADALSYLISGRPLQSANTTDRSAIAGAALSLGVQQTSPLTQALGSAVTLDELGMQGGTLDETEVVAGKQVGSDLYVRFTYGLFNRIGTVLARYKIGHNLSIEAGSGAEQSLDLVYSIETD